jgi:hypothetical protein
LLKSAPPPGYTFRRAPSARESDPLSTLIERIRGLSPDKRAALEQALLGNVERTPIAIVGVGCRFPGARGYEAFGALLAEGRDAIAEVPPDRFDVGAWFDADPDAEGRMYTRHGGFVDDVERFDAGGFKISPREAGARPFSNSVVAGRLAYLLGTRGPALSVDTACS